jgi:hypothetical protein
MQLFYFEESWDYFLIHIQQDATLHALFHLETALHISGGISAQHQERIQLYLLHLVFVTPLLLSAAIVEELELLCKAGVMDELELEATTLVNSSRCCKYSHVLLIMGENVARNM